MLVTENRGKGIRFTRIRLVIGPGKQGVVYKTADFHKPWNIGVTPDPAIQAKIDALNAQLAPILGTQIGDVDEVRSRAPTSAAAATGRTCESLVGNVVTDAMRTTLQRDRRAVRDHELGRPPRRPDVPEPGPRGRLLPVVHAAAVPDHARPVARACCRSGTSSVTLSVNGAELKTMLENGVSRMPAVDGRFPQVSGLCFTYDIAAPAGSRVTAAVVADRDGNCTATPVDLTAGSTYTIAENDFMATGGDGYPNFASRMTTQDIMEQVDGGLHRRRSSPLTPVVRAFPNGRINCADSNGATAPNCPALVPSP